MLHTSIALILTVRLKLVGFTEDPADILNISLTSSANALAKEPFIGLLSLISISKSPRRKYAVSGYVQEDVEKKRNVRNEGNNIYTRVYEICDH